MFSNTYIKLHHLQALNRELNTKHNGRMTKTGAEIEKLVAQNLLQEKEKQYELIGEREGKILSLELKASEYEASENPYHLLDEQVCR
jgi:hypothetical protein